MFLFFLLRRSYRTTCTLSVSDGISINKLRYFCSPSSLTQSESSSTSPLGETESCSKIDLLRREGFSNQHIQVILSKDPRSDKLALLLTLLSSCDITGATAASFLCSNPNLLSADLNNVRLKLDIIRDAGLHGELLKKAILMKKGILSLKVSPESLQKRVSFLKEAGLDPFEMCLTMARFPDFIRLSVENNLKPRYELLLKRGVSKAGLFQILRNYPRVFAGSENPGLVKKLDLIERFGFDLETRSGVRALGLWSISGPDSLLAKFEFVQQKLGFSYDLAVALVRRQPNLLCLRADSIEKKVKFLKKTLGRDLSELLSCPTFLTCSLEKRLIPRFAVVKKLKQKGLLEKDVPISSIVSVSDAAFQKRFKL